MSDLVKVKNRLDKLLGKDEQFDFLLSLKKILTENMVDQQQFSTSKKKEFKQLLNKLEKIENTTRKKEDIKQIILSNISDRIKKLKLDIPEKLKVEVTNQSNFPTSIKVSNFPTRQLDIKKPKWYKEFDYNVFAKLLLKLKNTRQKVDIDWPDDPKRPIPVRLSSGKKFYNAIFQAVASGVSFPTSTAPTIYNITMTDADTEYSQILPNGTDRFTLQSRTDFDIRFAFEAGKVATPTAPYMTLKAGQNYYESDLDLKSKTVYVACGTAGKVAELIVWT